MKNSPLFLIALVFFLGRCSKKDDTPAPPTDTIDMYYGWTYSRYAFKNPVNGKQVYYYLTFGKNSQINSYIKYNKTEATTDEAETGTYSIVPPKTGTIGVPGGFMFTFKDGTFPVEFISGKLTIHKPSGDLAYTRE